MDYPMHSVGSVIFFLYIKVKLFNFQHAKFEITEKLHFKNLFFPVNRPYWKHLLRFFYRNF